MDSWLPHHYSAAGVPTNADECLEAVQSDLTGHSARFLMVYGICSTGKLFRACSKQLCCQEVNTIVGQSTSLQKLAYIRHCKQEGLKPSLVALFNAASSPAQKVLLLCIDFSSIEDDGLKIDLKVVGLKVDLEAW